MRRAWIGLAAGLALVGLAGCYPDSSPPPKLEAVATVGGVQVQSQEDVITPDGRYVLFTSFAKDVVPGFAPAPLTLYRKDRKLGVVEKVSVTPSGEALAGSLPYSAPENVSMSDDGRYVVWDQGSSTITGTPNGGTDVYLRDMVTKTNVRVSATAVGVAGNGEDRYARISGNGRWVTFRSTSTNLAPTLGAATQVLRWDRVTGAFAIVSVGRDGGGAAVAPDGDSQRSVPLDDGRVVFESSAGNLIRNQSLSTSTVRTYLANPATGAVDVAAKTGAGAVVSAYLVDATPDGSYLLFRGYVAPSWNFYLRNLRTGAVEVAAKTSTGSALSEPNAVRMSNDARYVLFTHGANGIVPGDANGIVDAFVRDRTTGRVALASQADGGGSLGVGISSVGGVTDDGRTATIVTEIPVAPFGGDATWQFGTVTSTHV